MKKYFQIIKAYFRYSVMMEMEYKFNFFFGGIFELLWLIMYIALINVIFLGTTDIAGWEKYEVLMLTFQGGLIDALVTLIVVPGLCQIPEYVNTGKLDFVLLKPINTRFHLSLRCFSLDQIKNILINIIGIIYCIQKLQIKINFETICMYFLLTICSILIIYNIMFMLMSLSFWVIKMDVVMNFCAELITIGNKPYTIYPQVLQKILTYGLPIIVAFNFPVLNILEENFFEFISIAIIVIISWFIITNIILKRGLRKYVSTGS
ncbi:MAG: ABC transporter permease [Eisenbergiella sp.]